MIAAQLNQKFGIPDALTFAENNRLVKAIVSTKQANAEIYLQGAHLTHWQPKGQQPVIFTSALGPFEHARPIRGGIPVIFPWFGPRGNGEPGPSHGFARIQSWNLESAHLTNGGELELAFTLEATDLSADLGYSDFLATLRFVIGSSLSMALTVDNAGTQPLRIQDAFHTYFTVGDVRQIRILRRSSCRP